MQLQHFRNSLEASIKSLLKLPLCFPRPWRPRCLFLPCWFPSLSPLPLWSLPHQLSRRKTVGSGTAPFGIENWCFPMLVGSIIICNLGFTSEAAVLLILLWVSLLLLQGTLCFVSQVANSQIGEVIAIRDRDNVQLRYELTDCMQS